MGRAGLLRGFEEAQGLSGYRKEFFVTVTMLVSEFYLKATVQCGVEAPGFSPNPISLSLLP